MRRSVRRGRAGHLLECVLFAVAVCVWLYVQSFTIEPALALTLTYLYCSRTHTIYFRQPRLNPLTTIVTITRPHL